MEILNREMHDFIAVIIALLIQQILSLVDLANGMYYKWLP